MNSILLMLAALLVVSLSSAALAGDLVLRDAASDPADFTIASDGRAATIVVDPAEAKVVHIAADLLAGDVERAAGVKSKIVDSASGQEASLILVGTIGQSAIIDDLIKRQKLDVQKIQGQWESFIVTTVTDPLPGVKSALVVVGSDRRGTAYGALSISETIGVSPWTWWADVPVTKRKTLVVSAALHQEGPPSVKYRGIFINDEDWGLQPWAAKNYEPESKDIGPKTYARVFELLLRLRANYCWPAMHECTRAFNMFPDNKRVADDYAIVMGSSHAEPMLRCNVSEWPHDQAKLWNPITNLPGILDYWEQRVKENGQYENTWTVGMRGIHDSGMPGGGTLDEKRERLEKIIGLQRDMLAKHVNPDPARVPQMFCPYKEVLDIYNTGMTLPDDITIVWPDDNHGYIRHLPDARERQRTGGHGIYYHLSYWGRPHDFLWLDSTPPALTWYEMTKAYDLGARQLWVVNVGDIKPIESGMDLFLRIAWDHNRYEKSVQHTFLHEFYTEQFGQDLGPAIADLKDEYFKLCAVRRPEHMGFNRVYFSNTVSNSPIADSDGLHDSGFLERWQKLARDTEALAAKIPESSRDAYFQLVEYPSCAAAAMAEKILLAEQARNTGSEALAKQAHAAFDRIGKLTERYNNLGGGKWRGMMDYRPRKLPVFDMPSTTPPTSKATGRQQPKIIAEIATNDFSKSTERNGVAWKIIPGLSPQGQAVAPLPVRDTPTLRLPEEIRAQAPVVEYEVAGSFTGEVNFVIDALPTHAITRSHELIIAVSINDELPTIVHFDSGKDDEGDPTWQANVLRHTMTGTVRLKIPAARSTLKLWAADPSVVVQRMTITAAN